MYLWQHPMFPQLWTPSDQDFLGMVLVKQGEAYERSSKFNHFKERQQNEFINAVLLNLMKFCRVGEICQQSCILVDAFCLQFYVSLSFSCEGIFSHNFFNFQDRNSGFHVRVVLRENLKSYGRKATTHSYMWGNVGQLLACIASVSSWFCYRKYVLFLMHHVSYLTSNFL